MGRRERSLHFRKEQLYKYVNGKIVILKNRKDSKGESKDKIYIYLEVSPSVWYYFEYSNGRQGRMEVVSSDNDFNTALSETKEDKLKYKGEKGVEDYEIILGSASRRSAFFSKFDTE